MNTGAPWPDLYEAEPRVLAMQTKLHQWAISEPDRCFDDLFNLVSDPAFLVVAWSRVRGNKGARTAGVDGVKPNSIVFGVEALLAGLRDDLRARRFRPQRVREKTIPKASGKVRRLGIPTVGDRVVQASLKLVLEPIFEADFKPCSYGFRPRRRAQDAIAEIHFFGSRTYEWVFEADIEACFDQIDHTALMERVRHRIGDKRVTGLVKAFLRAGILGEDSKARETITGTPQGGILSPLLANIALSVLDEHFTQKWEALGPAWTRAKHRRAGMPTMRIVRYADDFVRHEAPHVRVEMKGLHRWPVAAGRRSWGQSDPGDAGEGGKQPRQRRDIPVLPDGVGPASETRRCNESEPVATLLNPRAGSNLVDMGRSAVHEHLCVEVFDSDSGRSPRSGGHTECLRRRCGEAAGAQLGTSLVDRHVVNVGTVPVLPFPLSSQGSGGQVRCRLMTPGRDGALVVVRAPESGAHGEGGQRVRSSGIGMPGGRR